MDSLHDVFFVFFFSILMMIYLLLGETYVAPIVQGVFILFFLYFNWRQSKNLFAPLLKKINLTWIVLLIATFFSLTQTHNLPLSINAFFFALFSYVIFFSVVSSKKTLPKEMFFNIILVIVSVFSFMSLVLFFREDWARRLPGMNLLFSTFGHNHISALLLLVLPLSWLKAFQSVLTTHISDSHRLIHNYLFFLPIFLTTTLVLSFGRADVLIYLIQFSVWSLMLFRGLVLNEQQRKKAKYAFIFIFTALLFVIFLRVTFSIWPIFDSKFECPLPQFRNKLCKTITSEPRKYYWQQAFQAFRDFPVWGYGPGTYSLISNKYQQAPFLYTAFAHNFFLQIFAESGVFVGCAHLLLFGFISYGLLKILMSQTSLDDKAVIIGIFSILFLSLVDFSLNFSALFTLILIGIAVLFRDVFVVRSNMNRVHVYPFYFLILAFSNLCFSVGFIFIESLISLNQSKIAFSIFPYFISQKSLFEKENALKADQQSVFEKIYWNDPEVVLRYSAKKALTAEQYFQLVKIKPLGVLQTQSAFSNQEQYPLAVREQALDKLILLKKRLDSEKLFSLSPDQQDQFLSSILSLADQEFKERHFAVAGKYYRYVNETSPLFVGHRRPVFVTNLDYDQKILAFFDQVSSREAAQWGDYGEEVANFYTTYLLESLRKEWISHEQYISFIQNITDAKAWSSYTLFEQTSDILYSQIETAMKANNREKAKKLMRFWEDGYAVMVQKNSDINDNYRVKVMQNYRQMLIR